MDDHSRFDPSIEQILVHIAQKYAPRLIVSRWQKPGDLKIPLHALARQLANYHIFVVLAERTSENGSAQIPAAVHECHEIYVQMYHLLADAAFPSLKRVNSFFYHGRNTLIIVFEAEARLVVEALAGFVAPYVAERQHTRAVANMELTGLMDKILHKLDLMGLPDEDRERLRQRGADLLKQLLKMQLRQLPLTPFDEPFFSQIEVEEDTAPAPHVPPPKPPMDDLPGKTVNPFEDGTMPLVNGDDPDFIRRMNEPQHPAEPPRPAPGQPRSAPPSPETGPQPPVEDDNDRSNIIRLDAPVSNTPPLPPLPPPPPRRPKNGRR